LIRDKHRLFDLCTKYGTFERRISSKSHGNEGGYKDIKLLDWGDLWRFVKRIPSRMRKEGA
jgi:ribosomal protein RSM22 (predicted rRNA methylase)